MISTRIWKSTMPGKFIWFGPLNFSSQRAVVVVGGAKGERGRPRRQGRSVAFQIGRKGGGQRWCGFSARTAGTRSRSQSSTHTFVSAARVGSLVSTVCWFLTGSPSSITRLASPSTRSTRKVRPNQVGTPLEGSTPQFQVQVPRLGRRSPLDSNTAPVGLLGGVTCVA